MVTVTIKNELMDMLLRKWRDDHPSDASFKKKYTYIVSQLIKEYINDIIIFNYNKKRKE